MRHNRLNLTALMPGALLLLLFGCLGPGKSSPTRFYVLEEFRHRCGTRQDFRQNGSASDRNRHRWQ